MRASILTTWMRRRVILFYWPGHGRGCWKACMLPSLFGLGPESEFGDQFFSCDGPIGFHNK